ncbi:uncharacterized protein LOC134800066 [Cydia splendana]|uniref:uncharacterized protein LOC134800066 n=1 Tax=Cydia splendana TaxID=1100963 RepID=UPI00300D9334
MTPCCLFLILLIQGSFTFANCDEPDSDSREILNQKPEFEDNVVKDFSDANKDWLDMFLESTPSGLYPSSSAAIMAHATISDKSPEEQLEVMKDIIHQITEAIEHEMTNLLSDAIAHCEKDEGHTKKKRSIETPMDSSQLVMRLLKHIKSNNEYQNIAIEKMMTAQEIADKYGVKYNPDEDVLADLAAFSSKQSEELASILGDENAKEEIEFVPLENEENKENVPENNTYYVYATHVPEEEIHSQFNSYPPHEYMPERLQFMPQPQAPQQHYKHPHHSHHYFPETQIPAPPHHAPAPQRPYHEAAYPREYHPCGPMEPITTTTTIVLPYEEPIAPEPELVGQVFEETVSNKVFIEAGEEPGSTDVNHVMTYTVSEKSHFKTPEIEKLPQQMQYYFFLMN